MTEAKSYVRVDEHGVYRVADTRVMLDSVVAAFRQGNSPESIRQQYPTLSLEQVYGSIAFYLSNVNEMNAYFARQETLWKEWKARTEAQHSPVVERLRWAFQVPEAT